jgi:DNA-binding transcriptional regulator YiaG
MTSAMSWSGSRVARLRKKLRLSQEKFAAKLGVTVTTVNRWENDKSKPRGLSLQALDTLEGSRP